MESFTIFNDYITLGQFLKEFGIISTGGQAKIFLTENEGKILYNEIPENRRGKKLYPNDTLQLLEFDLQIKFVKASAEEIKEQEELQKEAFRIKELEKQINNQPKSKRTAAPKSPFQK